ncbi:MAG: sigma-70 family RNA polymerase sigma factor [Actinomycetota bacterium]
MSDLVARFRAGEENAVREVHQRYGGAVRTVASSMIADPELVAEVVQQTFIKAWRAAATFDENRDLAPWLYSIARRTAIDVIRREQRTPGPLGDTEPATSGPSFERTWEQWQVRQAIADLPSGERDVVRLSHLAGLTHDEIAERLGIPVGTVKSRSGRAHKRLAAALRHLDVVANREPDRSVQGHDEP